MRASRPKKLLASIHDVSPRFDAEIEVLADHLSSLLEGPRFAMLVVPDHWGQAPLAGNTGFQGKLRRWSESGIEMFVHGWFHKDATEHRGFAAFKARHMTAREGEFLGLSYEDARRRMLRGKDLLEDIIGRPAAGFIAPAWLYGAGARTALAECGFSLAEDHWRVWSPSDETTRSRSPVITWASRSPARIAASVTFAKVAPRLLGRMQTVRVAVHPGDVHVPALVGSIGSTIARLRANRVVSNYASLL